MGMHAALSCTQPALKSADIAGLKFFSQHLLGALDKLHAHHDDPKRVLHYDQYLCLLLLSYYNPVLSSLRALQAATQVTCRPSTRPNVLRRSPNFCA